MQVEVMGSPIHYEKHGQGRPVLCLHGFPEDHRAMAGCLESLFSGLEGYQRIYVDLPGMGKSPANPQIQNADGMLDTIQAFIDKVIGKSEFLLVGQSYGGYLSLGLALQNLKQIAGLFLLCPCVLADRTKRTLPPRQVLHEEVFSLEPGDNPMDFQDFRNMAVVVTEETWIRYKREILPGLSCADTAFVQRYQGEGYGFSYEKNFQNIRFNHPVSFLLGRQDDCVGYADAYALMECFPRASFEVIDAAGHNLQIEQPHIFANSFLNWLNRAH